MPTPLVHCDTDIVPLKLKKEFTNSPFSTPKLALEILPSESYNSIQLENS